MLSNVERTFNEIWGVSQQRTISRKIANYISMLFLGPFLMVLSTAMMASFSSNTIVAALMKFEIIRHFFVLFAEIIPHAVLWLAFTMMYMLMPNTRVKFLPALVAGVLSASLWEGAFRVYTEFNIGVANYNTIYGTFAVLPIFIIWLYVSWLIVLVGAQLSYAIQNIRAYQMEVALTDVGHAEKEAMALHLMAKIASRFHQGLPPLDTDGLSRALSVPVRLAAEITRRLCDRGLIQTVGGDATVFQPARNPALISVLDVFKAMRHEGGEPWQVPEAERTAKLRELLESMQKTELRELGSVSLEDLVAGSGTIAA
jgi:membrane protein